MGTKCPHLFKLIESALIAPITLFLIHIFGPKCPQLFKFKLREFVSLTRIILFPRFRPPKLAKSPRQNPKEKVGEANPISAQQDARSGFVWQVRRIQARRRSLCPKSRETMARPNPRVKPQNVQFKTRYRRSFDTAQQTKNRRRFQFYYTFTFIRMSMHVHRFLNFFRGCRALYAIYFSMSIGLPWAGVSMAPRLVKSAPCYLMNGMSRRKMLPHKHRWAKVA